MADRIERGLLEASERCDRHAELRTQNAHRFAGHESQPRGVLGERVDTDEAGGDVVNDVAALPVKAGAADGQAQSPLGLAWIERVFGARLAGAKRARHEQHRAPLRISRRERVVLSEDRRARHRDEADSGSCASTEPIDQTRQRVEVSPRFDDHDEARRGVERNERIPEQVQRMRNGARRRRQLQPDRVERNACACRSDRQARACGSEGNARAVAPVWKTVEEVDRDPERLERRRDRSRTPRPARRRR